MRRSTTTTCEAIAAAVGSARASGGDVGRVGRGFTLMEVLVAVGAIAILSVGIASIFSAIGKTVSGGRRVSQLTAQAAQIETAMRQDFARMTRDGFLMVRQQLTNTGGPRGGSLRPVPLSPTDQNTPRVRRIDEVMFFAKGEFSSSREAVSSAYETRADAARIYYGHGTRQADIGEPRPPALTDYNHYGGMLGQPNSLNTYASDWTLVRHQCLLVDTRQTQYDVAPALGLDPTNPADRKLLLDKEGQVSLQPAGLSIFRHLMPIPQTPPNPATYNPLADKTLMLRTGVRRMGSGLVDVATVTFREIRDVVVATRMMPRQFNQGPTWFTTHGPDPTGSSYIADNKSGPPFPIAQRMQAWMEDAWPTPSDPTVFQFENMLGAYNGIPMQVPTGGRIRVEPRPAHLLEALRGEGKFNSPNDRIAADYRVDQLQLAANGFLRGCSEFIVDWSFGEPDPMTGELVWYGLSRFADLDGSGAKNANEPMLTRPFPFRAFDDTMMDPFTFPYYTTSGEYIDGTQSSWASSGGAGMTVTDHVYPALIHGLTAPATAAAPMTVLNSYFGYDDPTGAQGRPWAWPEFIRVTVKLVDPQDVNTEQTFQYVFKTPGNGVSRS